MNYKNILKLSILVTGMVLSSSCKKFLDINVDPDRIPADNAPVAQLLTHSQVNLAFSGGSDLFRFTSIIAQHMSGQASQPNQTYEYDRYNITGSDQNNVWSSIFATTLSDLEIIIKQTEGTSPHYAGIAKIMKAYQYSLVVDTWGDVPYSEALKQTDNLQPSYDDDETIYPKLIALLTDAVGDLNATTSVLTPGSNSLIYPGTFSTVKANWIKLANTLRLRLYLHYSKKDPAYMLAQITALVNSTGVQFFASNADNFQMAFFNIPNNRNPIAAFEVSRPNYLFAAKGMVDLMNAKNDPRRSTYFTPFPYTSTSYKGVTAGDPPTFNYSRIHTFLRGGPTTGTAVPNAQGGIPGNSTGSLTYTGAAPIRMLTFAEYNFIRAEAALRGAPGDAQAFYTAGITASMQEAGVVPADITTYLAANGTLTGTFDQKLKQIIEEKYVANFGVAVEPWTDWRRTGYPVLTPPSNRMPEVVLIPRSLFYPQSEIDLNPNAPDQKPADLQTRVFWDTP